MYIVGRTTAVTSIKRVFFFIDLCQCSFNKSCGRTEQGSDPHPEYSAGASGRNRRDYTDQITHTDPGSCGNDQCLNTGNRVFFRSCLFFCGNFQHFRKETEGKKFSSKGKINSRRNENENKQGKSYRTSAGKG